MSENYTPPVTRELLEAWKAEDARLGIQERVIKEQRAIIRRMIDDGTKLLPTANRTPNDSSQGNRTAASNTGETLPAAIIAYLDKNPAGEKGGKLNEIMRADSRFKDRLQANSNAVYSALSELFRTHRVKKNKDGQYFHPRHFAAE